MAAVLAAVATVCLLSASLCKLTLVCLFFTLTAAPVVTRVSRLCVREFRGLRFAVCTLYFGRVSAGCDFRYRMDSPTLVKDSLVRRSCWWHMRCGAVGVPPQYVLYLSLWSACTAWQYTTALCRYLFEGEVMKHSYGGERSSRSLPGLSTLSLPPFVSPTAFACGFVSSRFSPPTQFNRITIYLSVMELYEESFLFTLFHILN